MFFCLLNESYILTLESGKVSGSENRLLVCSLKRSLYSPDLLRVSFKQQHHLNVAEQNLSWLKSSFSLCVSSGQRLAITPPPVVSPVQPSLCSSV